VGTAASQIILLHPILKEIIAYQLNSGDFLALLTQAEQESDPSILPIPHELFASIKEVKYYYHYYLFLEENKFFDEFSLHKMTGSRYTATDIRNSTAGTSHISFEVTDDCNLECAYCCYGPLYFGYDNRICKYMTFDTARRLIDHWLEIRRNRPVIPAVDYAYFGFYGGEPLLNFPLIQQVVEYVKKNIPASIKVGFAMTTNGTLLDKYMDFLVENDFQLMISLDGDFEHNKYRVYKNGGYTFETIYTNIELMRKKYPDYYNKNVDYNAIIHARNNGRKVMDFFQERFDKTPNIASLSTIDVKNEKKKVFEYMSRVQPDEIPTHEAAATAPKKNGKQAPSLTDVFNVRGVVFSQTGYIVRKYSQLLENQKRKVIVSTGTCAPFSKKIFATVNGKLLPCERIPQYYSLGTIDETGVHLDYENIARKYNAWYAKMVKRCNNCHDCHYCGQCIFHLNLEDECVTCEGYKSKEGYAKSLAGIISKIEASPATYLQVFKSTGINDDREHRKTDTPSQKKRDRCLYLHPYVHLNVKKDRAVVYNTLKGSLMEFSRKAHPEAFALLKKLNRDQNLYVIQLDHKKISPQINEFIESLRRSFSGDITAASRSNGKPIQFKPILKLEDPTETEQLYSVKPKMKILPGDKLGEYLNSFNLYINESCTLDCDFCSTAYRQFHCCYRKQAEGKNKNISLSRVTTLCRQLEKTNLMHLNILGGNILLHQDLESITAILNKAPFQKNWYLHWRNLAQKESLPVALSEGKNGLHLICRAPVEKEAFKTVLDIVSQNGCTAVYHFVLASEKDFTAAEAMVQEFGLEDCEFHPFYISGDGNIDFFKENIFIDRDSIKESALSMQDVFARATLNTLNFKQMTMMCDGRIYANVNHPLLGKFPEISIPELIKKEMIQGQSWGRTRKNVMPCKSCPYNALCPPVSNYEYNLKRYNLCNIFT
ncbi:MAG: radical SAM peptide maturase, partial [bacterium]|nr:radical SAM peptide maturase [bacterium]